MKKVIASLFTFAIFLTGCGGNNSNVTNVPSNNNNTVSDSIAKETGEKLAEQMLGGIDIEYAEEGSGDVVAWPGEIPADVPVFKYGKIDATLAAPATENGNDSIMIQFREVEAGAYDKYEQDLKNAGWTIDTDYSWTDGHMSAKKGSRSVDIDVDPMGENTAFLYYLAD